MVTLLEPDVALTDFGLAAECAALAAWLHWRSGAARPLQTWFVIFFLAVGIAAFLGGITHGFLADIQSTIYGVMWSATMLAIGLAAVACWAIGAHLLLSGRAAKRVVLLAGSLFVPYAATVLAVSQSFTVAVVFYVPAVTFVLIAFVLTWLRRPRNDVLAGIVGLILSFAAAAIQQTETAILGLTHNALYHLVQAVALLLIFVAARGMTRET